MGFNQVKVFKSWSFSRWKDYDTCPAFAKYKHIDKLPAPKHPAAERGIQIAKDTEDWFNGDRRNMPKELKPLEKEYRVIKADKSTIAECGWAFTKEWEPCEMTDWNRCWLRVKIDLFRKSKDETVLKIDDNKTGKYTEYNVPSYELQLDLYAAAGVVMFPRTKTIETRLLFSDLGIIHPQNGPAVYTAKQALASKREWEKRVKPMFADTRFAPRPSNFCRGCPYSKAKGGPCKF